VGQDAAAAQELFSLRGKVAIVTGSTRGIGLATVRLLARQGASVVVSSRKAEACDAVCAELAAGGATAIAIPAHAGREADCRRLVEQTQARFGRLDIVVANAAVNPVFESLSTLAEESWNKVLDTNLTGPWRLARFALPIIAQQGGGALLFVSSINARLGVPRSAAYGVSKAALEQLTRQLAIEWGGKNVRINAVAPGTTRTDMIRALTADPSFLAAVEARTPMKRIGEPEDVAAAIVFLVSDAARHVTGQVLTVDGGETILRGSN
jgi:NAD(P)-dependent dehydrogenase (short-subunit alcohol dehydrogenase family)